MNDEEHEKKKKKEGRIVERRTGMMKVCKNSIKKTEQWGSIRSKKIHQMCKSRDNTVRQIEAVTAGHQRVMNRKLWIETLFLMCSVFGV